MPKEALMRIPALAILTIATALTSVPARAQTYDPAYPVCLHVYARGANSATVVMNNTASASVIGHMTRPSNWSTMILAVATVTESRRPSSFAATSRKRRRCAG
jgi:hypothetical protein